LLIEASIDHISPPRTHARAFGELEREILRERTRAGLIRSRMNRRRLGRPATATADAGQIRTLHGSGLSKSKIALRPEIGRISARPVLTGFGRAEPNINPVIWTANEQRHRRRFVYKSLERVVPASRADIAAEMVSGQSRELIAVLSGSIDHRQLTVPPRRNGRSECEFSARGTSSLIDYPRLHSRPTR